MDKSKNFRQLYNSFEDKETINEIVNAYLEKGIASILSIVKYLDFKGLTDKQKKEMIMIYINNAPYVSNANDQNIYLREIICNDIINKRFCYEDLKKIIAYYLYDNKIYFLIKNGCLKNASGKEIINNIEEYIKYKLSVNQTSFGIPKKQEFDYSKLLYIITSDINIFKYRVPQEIDELIYASINDEEEILPDIILNNNLLKYRNIDDQLKLMQIYLSTPYIRVSDLILDEKILKELNMKQQEYLILLYLTDKSEKNYEKIQQSAYKMIENLTEER